MPHTNSNTKEKYYQLGCDLDLDSGYVKKLRNKHRPLMNGNLVAESDLTLPWPFTIKPDPEEGFEMSDYYGSSKLMSKRLVEAMQSAGVTNLQLFPAEIKNTQTDEIVRDYYVVNIIGLVSGADRNPDKSIPLAGGWVFNKTVIDARNTSGLLVFRLKESIIQVIVHEQVAKVIRDDNFKGVTLEPVVTLDILHNDSQ